MLFQDDEFILHGKIVKTADFQEEYDYALDVGQDIRSGDCDGTSSYNMMCTLDEGHEGDHIATANEDWGLAVYEVWE